MCGLCLDTGDLLEVVLRNVEWGDVRVEVRHGGIFALWEGNEFVACTLDDCEGN